MSLILSGSDGLSDVDGTAATPAIRGTDANTGISFGTDTVTISTGGVARVTTDASGNVGIGTDSPGAKLDVNGEIRTSSNIIRGTGSDTVFLVGGSNNNNNIGISGGSAGTPNIITLTTAGSERARIDSSGRLLVGTTSVLVKDSKLGSYSTVANQFSAFFDHQSTVNAYGLGIRSRTGENIYFYNGTGEAPVGSVTTTGSTTAYNTSSDYRLKENVAPMTGALAKVAALKPVTYTWKADGSDGQGFIAHELQAVVPDCVTGEKDAVEIVDDLDAEGRKIGTKEVPRYQGVDTSFLVATLVAAIQEQQATISAMETRLAALEA
jgi:hypothetical protein